MPFTRARSSAVGVFPGLRCSSRYCSIVSPYLLALAVWSRIPAAFRCSSLMVLTRFTLPIRSDANTTCGSGHRRIVPREDGRLRLRADALRRTCAIG